MDLCWVRGGGIVDKFLISAFRKAYADNYLFKKLIDNLDKSTFKIFLNIFKKNLSKKDFYIIKSFIKKYITIETFTFFQNVLQVPKQIGSRISFKFVKDTLKRCKIKKTPPLKFERTDYRKFLQPFYSSNDKISKIFYNQHLHVLCKKIK